MKHLFSKAKHFQPLSQYQFASSFYARSLRTFSIQTNKVFVEGLPADWSHHEIAQRYGTFGSILKVNIVKNSMGQNTGKAIVTYDQEQSAENAVKKLNDTAVDDMVNKVRPFYDQKGASPRKDATLLEKRLYLMNLPYDATQREIETFIKEFAPIEEIAIPRDKSGRTRGYAFVYLKNKEDMEKVIEYVDGRHLRSRQIRVKKYLGEKDDSASVKNELTVENFDTFYEYAKFYQRCIQTQMFNPKLIMKEDFQSECLSKFDHAVNLFAQMRNISKEEALNLAMVEFEKMDSNEFKEQVKKAMESSQALQQNTENDWEKNGDKEKFPNLYFMDKLNDYLGEALNIPKEALYPSLEQKAKPFAVPYQDQRPYF